MVRYDLIRLGGGLSIAQSIDRSFKHWLKYHRTRLLHQCGCMLEFAVSEYLLITGSCEQQLRVYNSRKAFRYAGIAFGRYIYRLDSSRQCNLSIAIQSICI